MEINDFDIAIAFLVYPENYPNGKIRPCLIVRNLPKSIILFNITTKYKTKPEHIKQYYFPIKDWHRLGLDKISWIDTYRKYNIIKPLPHLKIIGKLPVNDIIALRKFIAHNKY